METRPRPTTRTTSKTLSSLTSVVSRCTAQGEPSHHKALSSDCRSYPVRAHRALRPYVRPFSPTPFRSIRHLDAGLAAKLCSPYTASRAYRGQRLGNERRSLE